MRGVVIVNAALLALLAAVSLGPRADAQRDHPSRARGDYTMISGRIMGGNSSVVYVMDAVNQEMVALRWNEGDKGLDGIGFRDLAADAAADPGR